MSTSIPVPEKPFHPVQTIDGFRYELPRRDLSDYRYFGWVLIAFGASGMVFMACWMLGPFLFGLQMLPAQNGFGFIPIIFSLLGLPGAYFCAGLMQLGYVVLADTSRCTVEINKRHVTTTEVLPFFGWRRRCKTSRIARLVVDRLDDRDLIAWATPRTWQF